MFTPPHLFTSSINSLSSINAIPVYHPANNASPSQTPPATPAIAKKATSTTPPKPLVFDARPYASNAHLQYSALSVLKGTTTAENNVRSVKMELQSALFLQPLCALIATTLIPRLTSVKGV